MKKLSLLLAILISLTVCMASCGVKTKTDDTPFAPGELNENVYMSAWLGLSFTPDASMEMSDAAELEYLMNPTENAYYTDEATGEVKLDFSKIGTVYDMLATDVDTNGSALVMAQYVEPETTVEAYIESLKVELESQLSDESELGDVVYSKVKTGKLAGEKYTAFEYSVSAGGMTLIQTMYIRKIGDRIANICFTYSSEAELNAFVKCFKAN